MSRIRRGCISAVTARRALAPDARTVHDEVMALESFLDSCIEAGVDLIQIRERDLEARILRDLTTRAVARAEGSTRLVVNDRADVARAANAGGVHLRADGPAESEVRVLGPASWLVGRSIHSEAEARAHASADYLLFGTVYESASKPGAGAAGLAALAAAAAAAAGTPVLAIGGITPERAADCIAAGAFGVAAIGLFLPAGRAPGGVGPARAVALLRAAMAERGC